jgi:hypothetical protein
MFDAVRSWELNRARQVSAAKGLMGACPHMHLLHPD